MNKSIENKILIENSLPHNFLAEKMILSCILFNSEVIERTQQSLSVNAFYFKNHQDLYENLLKMNSQNLPIDIITLTTFLQDKGLISKIGGIKVLLDLGNQVPTFSYLNDYIRIVKEKFLKRSLIKFGYRIINSGYMTNKSLEATITDIEEELFNLMNNPTKNQVKSTGDILNDVFDDLKEKFLNPKLPGLPSGFVKLDELTQGFQKSDLIIIAGRPSMGKTALGLNIALNSIRSSKLPILFFSLEMSKEQIIYRLLSTETGINQLKLRSGNFNLEDWAKLNKVIRITAKLPLFIEDRSNLSLQEIRSKIKTMIFEHSQLGLVIIDYLQLIKSLDSNLGNRANELSQITRYLKILAKEFNIPIIALSQLNRNVDNRIDQRPILSDLRESGSIEQDADLVFLLYRSKSSNLSPQITELIIAKHRNGPTGTVRLEFDSEQVKFSDSQLDSHIFNQS